MIDSSAATKADAILLALITNQPGVIRPSDMASVEEAKKTAAMLAAFRKKLIEELQEQEAELSAVVTKIELIAMVPKQEAQLLAAGEPAGAIPPA
ncbi:hypothetical protein D5041_19940 [Verminephrobacter aporrectodeae subsp. tuberculatae]|uniref:hypothetical protein n=1 Tax=Verminephrobacter aporrectodeae TaxID=1110389 RepID=UPI002237FAD8|nr:hypothetical protein [Verminephrobacter aporrectodeae]MCW5221923.1 hypothetical protein [Verminephrobacter aporrectodeae subsp. tuberculatae]MCW5291214.1 hypothetical protein [Verminephrobacter aporrectodeae subsp. tuberculatae]